MDMNIKGEPGVAIFLGIIALIAVLAAVFPEYAWWLSTGWKYKDLEPTDANIISIRVVAIIIALILVGIIVFGVF